MAGQNLANFDAVLKDVYRGPVIKQISDKVTLMNKLKRGSDDVSGRKWIFPLHYGRNYGVGSRADGATLMDAGHQSYLAAEEVLKYHYGRIEVTGPTIAASRNDAGAFIRALDSEIKGMTIDMRKNLNRQFLGDGTGALTKCGTTNDSTTVVVESTKYLKPGMKVDIRNSTTGAAITNGDSVEIQTVIDDTTFTLASPVSTTSAHSVYLEDSVGAVGGALVSYEANGIRNIIAASGVLHNVDPSTYSWWASCVDSTTTELSISAGQEILDAIDANDGEIDFILTSYAQRRKFIELGVYDIRFVSDGSTAKAKIGMKDPTFQDIPIVVDRDVYNDNIYFIDKSHLYIAQAGEMAWMDRDGAVLHRVSGKDAYEAVFYWYANLVCNKRNALGVMTAITSAAA